MPFGGPWPPRRRRRLAPCLSRQQDPVEERRAGTLAEAFGQEQGP